MTTLRVRLAAPPVPDRAEAWALFDAAGGCLRTGTDRPDAWPAADSVEIVLAASQLRMASVALPPVPPARVASAAGFALEDQLAGPAAAHHLAVSPQAPDGRVLVVIVSRTLLAEIDRAPVAGARIVAEPALALPLSGWRWCQGKGDAGGFVRCPDGSAFPVDAPAPGGELPCELALALAQATRDGCEPAHIEVDAEVADADLVRWQRETGTPFPRGTPWQWPEASEAAFADALDLRPNPPAPDAAMSRQRVRRAVAPALWLVGAAIILHVGATVGEWASLKLEAWRATREWAALAAASGVAPDAATTPQSARAALAERHAELRHARGLPAPGDALPLLARAAPALAAVPAGSVKSAAYASGHWTLELARADAAMVADLDARLRAAGLPALAVTSAAGARVRFGDL